MSNKSKNIQFYGNELRNADRDIDITKRLGELPMASLNIYNGSGTKFELQIWESLRIPLMEFLLNHFKKEKEKVYDKIKKELTL